MSYYDEEAIYQDADIEQMQYEREGRELAARRRKMESLIETDPEAAVKWCDHDSSYPLDSPAAVNNSAPRAGQQDSSRCCSCGSVLGVRDLFDWLCASPNGISRYASEVPIIVAGEWRPERG